MALCFRVFGTDDELPPPRELQEILEESEFEVSFEMEEEDEDNEEEWFQLLVYESSLDEPVTVVFLEPDELQEEIEELRSILCRMGDVPGSTEIRGQLEAALAGFRVEFPDGEEDDENALLLCHLIAQSLAQRTGGFFTVDNEAIFDEAGEMMLELLEVEEE